MAEAGSEHPDNREYKDHYKRILVDLIGKRNSAGILENEEAIEGTASNSLYEVGDQMVTAGQEDTTVESNRDVTSSTTARCHNLTSSLPLTLVDSTDDGLAVFHRKVPASEPGNGAAGPAASENQLLDDRKTPEGDLPPPVRAAVPDEARLSLTPEPSLMSLREEEQKTESGPEGGKPSGGQQKKKKWRIFKGFKNPLSPK